MANPIKEQITTEFGIEPILINSSLVSAQNRQRYYWTNIENIEQPKDKGIILKDIIESGIVDKEKSYCLKHQAGNARDYFKKHHTQIAFEPINVTQDNKAYGLKANYYKSSVANFINGGGHYPQTGIIEPICIAQRGRYTGENNTVQQNFEPRLDGKTNTISTVTKDNLIAEPIRIGDIGSNSQAHRVYSAFGKSVNIVANGGGQGAKTGLYAIPIDKNEKTTPIYEVKNGLIIINEKQYPIKLPDGYYIIRKLTPIECERLQTLPDNYTEGISATQRYKCLGNGWTAEVIIHILNYMNIPFNEEIIVLSMYDGIATGRYCLNKLGYKNIKYYAYEINEYAIKVAMNNYNDIIQCGDAFQVRNNDWKIN